MSEATLEKVIAHSLDAAEERVDFVWHGGEPLLAGLDFFKRIPALQAKHNKKGLRVLNNVQTNGTPLTPEFADFFEREGFSVGSSIQGTPEIHDRSRVTAGGGPTWKNVTLKLAQQGIAEEEALKKGMEAKSKEFVEKGAEVYSQA